jgi:hypothetical protein
VCVRTLLESTVSSVCVVLSLLGLFGLLGASFWADGRLVVSLVLRVEWVKEQPAASKRKGGEKVQ